MHLPSESLIFFQIQLFFMKYYSFKEQRKSTYTLIHLILYYLNSKGQTLGVESLEEGVFHICKCLGKVKKREGREEKEINQKPILGYGHILM